MPEIIAKYEDRDAIRSTSCNVDIIPDHCPVCHQGIEPIPRYGWLEHPKLHGIFECPRKKCRMLFIAYYKEEFYVDSGPLVDEYKFVGCAPWSIKKKEFPEEIIKISAKFGKIYNEAEEVEGRKLLNICGAGYRRAIEFLIKDYLIHEKADDAEKIINTRLGACVDNYINSERIKDCAKRAAWLGNDETHYIRKWEDKDLEDLKNLIQLTVNCIHDEHLTRKIKNDMPEGKAKSKK